MNHWIKEYWEDVKARECFVINVGVPYGITVLIRLCEFMDWYIIAEAKGEQNSEKCRYDLKELSEIIKKPESQYFFQINGIISDKEESLPFFSINDEFPGLPF